MHVLGGILCFAIAGLTGFVAAILGWQLGAIVLSNARSSHYSSASLSLQIGELTVTGWAIHAFEFVLVLATVGVAMGGYHCLRRAVRGD